MSKTSYYYGSPGDPYKTINKPGVLCDYCGEVGPAGTMVEMPKTPIDNEFGLEEGNIHAHLECAENVLIEYKEIVEKIEQNIVVFDFYREETSQRF